MTGSGSNLSGKTGSGYNGYASMNFSRPDPDPGPRQLCLENFPSIVWYMNWSDCPFYDKNLELDISQLIDFEDWGGSVKPPQSLSCANWSDCPFNDDKNWEYEMYPSSDRFHFGWGRSLAISNRFGHIHQNIFQKFELFLDCCSYIYIYATNPSLSGSQTNFFLAFGKLFWRTSLWPQ